MLHMDGFDLYSIAADLDMEYTQNNASNVAFGITEGRYAGGGVNVNFYNSGLGRALPTNPTNLWTGIAINPVGGSVTDQQIFDFVGNNGSEVIITYNYLTSTFKAIATTGTGNVLLAHSAWLFVPGTWHWIEAHCILGSGTSGTVELYVDGNEVFSASGVDTAINGSLSYTTMVLGSLGGAGTAQALYGVYDDWYMLDTSGSFCNARLGDSRIETRLPTGDAGPNNGTPSTAGTHFSLVDEPQWATTNNVTLTNTSGQEELYDMSALVSSPDTIFCCRVIAIMEKTDGGTLDASTVVLSNTTEADGPSTPALNTWCHIDGIQMVDPHTSAAWTLAAVNASQCGFKITTP
jgi:hypothetical protein